MFSCEHPRALDQETANEQAEVDEHFEDRFIDEPEQEVKNGDKSGGSGHVEKNECRVFQEQIFDPDLKTRRRLTV